MRSSMLVAGAVLFASAAVAQKPRTPPPVPDSVKRLVAAAELPVAAAHARADGVPDAQVKTALDAMRSAKLRPDEARQVIEDERTARKANGPVDNFGAFVQTKLAAGLRGRQLANAIKAEHVARGKKPNRNAGRPTAPVNARGGSKQPQNTKAKAPGNTKSKAPAATKTKSPAAQTKTKAPATKSKAPATKTPTRTPAKRPN